MLSKITLTNFKCFEHEAAFPIKKFNLLTGINGRGKSTLLQSILLIRQSLEYNHHIETIFLNGICVSLGNYSQVKNKKSKNDAILFQFELGSEKSLLLNLSNHDDRKLMVNGLSLDEKETLFHHFKNIHYIAADRIGPKDIYYQNDLSEFITVDKAGKNVAFIIFKYNQPIPNHLIKDSENAYTLETQIGAWLGYILDAKNVAVKIKQLDDTNALSLVIRINGYDYRPNNIGFGYSYILPILTAGLIAQDQHILVIENPEAHLHPRAQARLIEFLTQVAKGNVQIFVETHSDHILNGIRIAVKKQMLEHDETNILYFQEDEKHPFIEIAIQENGRIRDWPDGFFDQTEKDISILYKS